VRKRVRGHPKKGAALLKSKSFRTVVKL